MENQLEKFLPSASEIDEMSFYEEVIEALGDWVIYIANKKELATPEEIEVLPKVAQVFFENYSSDYFLYVEDKKSPQTATTECEEDISTENQRKIIENTKVISSDQLSELENVQIALRLYYLIANGDGKSGNDSLEVGGYLECLAYQLIDREKRA